MQNPKQLHFSTVIDAKPEKVWKVLWDDATYKDWTSVFSEGSYAVSDWKEGGKIQFLTPAGEGMYSKIKKMIPSQYMSFQHLGVIKNFSEQPIDEETKAWSGSEENYTLKENDGKTILDVDLDITADHESYFNNAFPKALDKVKQLSEN